MNLHILIFALLSLGSSLSFATESLEEEVAKLRNIVAELSRQSLLTQLHIEEKTRNDGDSGIKQVRHGHEGTESYFSDSHLGPYSTFTVHNHDNHIRTMGLGELTVVMNGVEFRTRHNDYALRSPSRSSRDWQATENIPFPDVPPEVLNKTTVQEQIDEMREWFKAFKNQNHHERDYRPYFKPVLCYMEGFWTQATDTVDESFESDRHFIDAESWFELQERIRYQAYSGAKDSGENLAYLPRIVINVTESGLPVFAQWNYDILCHAIHGDVPLNRFRVVDDVHGRMRHRVSLSDYESKRFARFKLNSQPEPFDGERQERNVYLDKLMYQIPGKDNYRRILRDNGPEGDEPKMNADNPELQLNAAKYHRTTFVPNKDAMGRQLRFRGYADANIWMAMTTQEKVAGMSMTNCRWHPFPNRPGGRRVCKTVDQKWTYAIPLEIVYMTPLSSWNPYNITYKGSNIQSPRYKSVTAGNRNGRTADRALNGVNSKNFYITPAEFYSSSNMDRDPADTTPAGGVWVEDAEGTPRLMRSSGLRIMTPRIPGVGSVRQRYPIAPIVAEGNTIYKELEALKQLVMDPVSHAHMMYNPITNNAGPEKSKPNHLVFNFKTLPSSPERGSHVHRYNLYAHHIRQLQKGNNVTITTGQANGHVHTLVLYSENGLMDRIQYWTCDGKQWCGDGHWKRQEQEEEY